MFAMTRIAQASKPTGKAYLRWRLVVLTTRATASYFTSIAELAFSTSSGGSQLPYVSATASSSQVSNTPDKALDSDPLTMWLSANGAVGPQWIDVQLTAAQKVTFLKIQGQQGSTGERSPRTFEVRASNDGVNYDLIYTSQDQPVWAVSESRNFYIGP